MNISLKMNSNITELNIIYKLMRELQDKYIFENKWKTEKLDNQEQIQKVLNIASKQNNGKQGKPDLIYWNEKNKLLILGEVKTSINFHKSKILSEPNPIKYCVDGISHYLRCFDKSHLLKYYKKHEVEEILSKMKSVKLLGLAVTDDSKNYIKKISTFSAEYKDNFSFVIDINPVLDTDSFLNEEDYLNIFTKKTNDYKNMINEVDKISNEVNNMLRSIDAQLRPIVLSGGIISLFTNDSDNNDFKDNFNNLDKENLFKGFFNSIKENLKKLKIFENKLKTVIDRFDTLKACRHELLENDLLLKILNKLNGIILPILEKYRDYDVMGLFYKRFLKYAGITDVKKGIILTPDHVAELFCELADLHPNDIVLDSCCGSGTFLIAAMRYMVGKSNKSPETIDLIKKNNLIGIENHSGMFILSLANMMFHGDGKAQVHFGDCFKKIDELKNDNSKPTVGFINPPYGGSDDEKNPMKKEIRFIRKMLEIVKKKLIVIAPISVFIQNSNLRKEILDKHTLKAVISMPDDLFMPNAAVKTAIAVFDANIPHDKKSILFYNLENDGYSNSKNKGRIDIFGRWDSIKKKLLSIFRETDESNKTVDGVSKYMKLKDYSSPWLYEYYMNVDFENYLGDKKYFGRYIRKYLEYQIKLNNELLNEDLDFITLSEIASNEIDISNLPKESNEEILSENCWNFSLGDIFCVLNKGDSKKSINSKGKGKEPVKAPNISNQEIYLDYGKILLIGAKNNNNGVVKVTTNEEKVREYKNCITLNKTGNGGAGLAFYQENIFISTSTVFVLSTKENIDKYSMIYLAALLSKFKDKYNFGFSMNNDSIKTEKIKLPFLKVGSAFVPDYSKMSKFIRSLRFSSFV